MQRLCSLLLLRLVIVLQEEVITGHCESPHQYDELGEIYLPVIVGVQVSHDLIHGLLILGILREWKQKWQSLIYLTHVYHASWVAKISSPYPQVVAKLWGQHLFELGPAQCVLVALVSRILMEGLDHELHGVLQGGGILWVGERHSGEEKRQCRLYCGCRILLSEAQRTSLFQINTGQSSHCLISQSCWQKREWAQASIQTILTATNLFTMLYLSVSIYWHRRYWAVWKPCSSGVFPSCQWSW